MRARKERSDQHAAEPGQLINSLFGEILDWMLAPLLFLWPLGIAVVYHVANDLADEPYDQALAQNVRLLARQVSVADGRLVVSLPAPARALLQHNEEDAIYFQVLSGSGELLAGDRDLRRVEAPPRPRLETVLFRDDELNGEEVRIAWQYHRPSGAEQLPPVVVQVAETRRAREALASRIISGVLLPQFAIIPLAVVLVYLGLGRGLKPLTRLQRLIERRRPNDLAPIAARGMPEEVLPLILAFNDLMARLEQNLQAQQRFIADAAHQMRTPIAGLKMQTELALRERDPGQVRSSLQQISDSADRTAHLINQLLALARAEASFEKLHQPEVVDLEPLLREVARDFVPQAMAKRIDFGLELTGWPLTVDGNALQLREMFKNLLDNAIKYTPEGGKVTARTVPAESAVVEIEDSGIGIAVADRERVFERFYRALATGASGSGLGLAIVREIAELHRARVLLGPNRGGPGTLAQVVMPRRSLPAAAPATGVSEALAAVADTSGKNA
jgi:two-component system sensor histidine kinase TctE